MLVFPEWFTSDRLNTITSFNWDLKPFGATGTWEEGEYSSKLTLLLEESTQKIEIKWEYEFINRSDTTITNLLPLIA